MTFTLIIFFVYFIIGQCLIDKNQWYIAQEDASSIHPPPGSAPQLFKKNSTHIIFLSGFEEHIAYNQGTNVFSSALYLLDVNNPSSIHWSKINVSPLSAEPSPRAYSCAVYVASSNKLYLYGGVNYNSVFTQVTFLSDSWVFNFDDNTWTLLTLNNSPGSRSSMSCEYIAEENVVLMTHGVKDSFTNFQDDTWRWDLSTNTWNTVNTGEVRPGKRALQIFKRVPDTKKFIFLWGISLTVISKALTYDDVWMFDSETNLWTQIQDVIDSPTPRNAMASAVISDKRIFIYGGHKKTNQTVADACKFPLQCMTDATSTNEAFILRYRATDNLRADWGTEEDYDFAPPALRRATMIFVDPFVYLVGGMGWNGKNGIGEEFNYNTWAIRI